MVGTLSAYVPKKSERPLRACTLGVEAVEAKWGMFKGIWVGPSKPLSRHYLLFCVTWEAMGGFWAEE